MAALCNPEKEPCAVCFNSTQVDMIVGPCGHHLCPLCTKQISSCPLCRGSLYQDASEIADKVLYDFH